MPGSWAEAVSAAVQLARGIAVDVRERWVGPSGETLPGRLPEVARSLGKAFNEFKKAKDELTRAVEEGDAAPPKSDGNGTPPSGDKP